MLQVTFKSSYKVKEKGKWVNKTSEWDEFIKTESLAKLRAMALNWEIVKIKQYTLKEVRIGQRVLVPRPEAGDVHERSFVGRVLSFDKSFVAVVDEDGTGDVFLIEMNRLSEVGS